MSLACLPEHRPDSSSSSSSLIVLLIFGPKRLPGLGPSLGSGMREFKDSVTGKGSDERRDDDADDEPTQANAALGRAEDDRRRSTARSCSERERSRASSAAPHRAMATALRPIAHEDRLSLVEHLDELRTRLIICLVAFVVAFGALLLAERRDPRDPQPAARADGVQRGDSEDPLEQAAAFQQAAEAAVPAQRARCARAMARSDEPSRDPRGRWAELSAAVARDRGTRRRRDRAERPVTLGVGEPFTVTVRVAAYAALLLALPLLLSRRTRSSCRPSRRASARSRCR